MKIGVFDSGTGGKSVANYIKQELPKLEVIYKDDKAHVPYGSRDTKEIHGFVKPIFQEFINEGCKVIVVACNTVTTNLIDDLRQEFKVPLIGMEPMVKPAAAASKSKIIAVLATPATLKSPRYKWLKETYTKGVKVLEPDCSDWGYMIEHHTVNHDKIAQVVEGACQAGADQIVLGCTHYHWIEDLIKQLAKGRAEVIQPEAAVVAQLKRVLEQLA
jgi:glutamate racemase